MGAFHRALISNYGDFAIVNVRIVDRLTYPKELDGIAVRQRIVVLYRITFTATVSSRQCGHPRSGRAPHIWRPAPEISNAVFRSTPDGVRQGPSNEGSARDGRCDYGDAGRLTCDVRCA